MNQPKTVDRGVALLKFVFELLKSRPEGMRPQDIYREIEARFPLDDFDRVTMSGSGLPRWRAALHFHSVSAVKAGLLEKSDGQWHLTDEGQEKSVLQPDDLKRLLRSRYREWRWGRQKGHESEKSQVNQDDIVPPPAHASVLLEDAKEKARLEIDAHLNSIDPYEFQSLVAALLEAMGYATSVVAARGPDGGLTFSLTSTRLERRRPIFEYKLNTETVRHRARKLRRFVELSAQIAKLAFSFHRAGSRKKRVAKRDRVRFISV